MSKIEKPLFFRNLTTVQLAINFSSSEVHVNSAQALPTANPKTK
jgi:hypothetical protein